MKNLDYLPPIIIGDDAGFSDPSFIPNYVGDLAQGAVNRSAFDIGKSGQPNSYIVDQMFKAKIRPRSSTILQRALDARISSYSADAINRARLRLEPDKDLGGAEGDPPARPDQLMIGYQRRQVRRHGAKHPASTFLIQLKGKEYVSIWPADRATSKIELPMKGWR